MCNIDIVCTTADVWSTNHKRYLGVTIHWIHPETLKRKSQALCIKRFFAPHSAGRIATLLSLIYQYNGVEKKIIGTFTDNAANFLAAFTACGITFEADDSRDLLRAENEGEQEEAMEEDIANMHSNEPTVQQDNDQIQFESIEDNVLSKHFRCSCHLFNLIATVDAEKALKKNAKFARIFQSSFGKLNSLFYLARQPKSSEAMQIIFKVSVKAPVGTGWNSSQRGVISATKYPLEQLNRVFVHQPAIMEFFFAHYIAWNMN